MIVLSATTSSIEVVLAGNVTTNQLPVVTSWTETVDSDSSATIGGTTTQTNNTTVVTVVVAPVSGKQRRMTFFSCYNADTATATLTVQYNDNGTKRVLHPKVSLGPGEGLLYTAYGWETKNAQGATKVAAVMAACSSILISPGFSTANLTTAKTITSGSSFALYMGKAPRSISSVVLRCRVTTAMATITWGEVAVAKGTIVVGGNPSLTVVGYTDVSATYNSTGQKSTTITVSAGQSINEGDDLWVLIGNSATTALQVRAASIADDIQTGMQASAASRPSTIVGTPTSFTIEGATTVPAWVGLIL
jgi:hypothetical protein